MNSLAVAAPVAPAPPIVRELVARGLSVALDGDDLVIRPVDRVTPDLLDRVRANKPAIVAHLAATAGGEGSAAADDPALWLDPEPDGLADGLAALVDELIVVERRIVDGRRFVVDRAAAGTSVPRSWHDRLGNLIARHGSLVALIAERVPEAQTRQAALHRRIERQWVWLWAAPNGPEKEARTDVWLRWLARFEAICDALIALDRAMTGGTSDAVDETHA